MNLYRLDSLYFYKNAKSIYFIHSIHEHTLLKSIYVKVYICKHTQCVFTSYTHAYTQTYLCTHRYTVCVHTNTQYYTKYTLRICAHNYTYTYTINEVMYGT